jgi:hypothetical protein
MKCEDCKWWVRLPQVVTVESLFGKSIEVAYESPRKAGECRFNAPNEMGKFPIMLQEDFCGKFKQKENQ